MYVQLASEKVVLAEPTSSSAAAAAAVVPVSECNDVKSTSITWRYHRHHHRGCRDAWRLFHNCLDIVRHHTARWLDDAHTHMYVIHVHLFQPSVGSSQRNFVRCWNSICTGARSTVSEGGLKTLSICYVLHPRDEILEKKSHFYLNKTRILFGYNNVD